MNDIYYNQQDAAPVAEESAVNAFVAKVFGWMFIGLLATCLSTVAIMMGINASDAFLTFIDRLTSVVMIVFIAQVVIVWVVSARVAKMNPAAAILLYLIYSIVNGFTIGLFALLLAGNMATVGLALGVTSVSFGIMAVYGLVTKADVTKAGSLLRMALIGLILITVLNVFLRNGALDFVICIAGLFIFLGLTAYDTKKIKTYFAKAAVSRSVESEYPELTRAGLDQEALASNLAIVGALMLYLDFINMFLFILRLINGGRR